MQVAVAAATVLVWVAVVVVMPPRCSTLTVVISSLVLLSLQFVRHLPVDVPAVVVATVEPVVDSMGVLPLS